MARRYGRRRRGERLRASVPHDQSKMTTFVSGLRNVRYDGDHRARWPINRDAFTAYVTLVLVPVLAPGGIAIMDNLSNHKGQLSRDPIEAAGAEWPRLPPYSSDFNPIERAFSKLKANSHKAAERTIHGLRNANDRILDLYSLQECANYFTACGYDAT